MAVINRLPAGAGVNAKGFVVTPWFVKGIVYNADIFGVPTFYTQTNARVNSDTYATDGYIHTNYTSTGFSATDITTGNYLPTTYDFALIRLKNIRSVSDAYALALGSTNTRSDITRGLYRWVNTNASEDIWLTIPLNVFNTLGVSEYLGLGGSTETYIYEIYFMKVKQ